MYLEFKRSFVPHASTDVYCCASGGQNDLLVSSLLRLNIKLMNQNWGDISVNIYQNPEERRRRERGAPDS